MARHTIIRVPTKQRLLLSKIANVELPTHMVMSLAMDEDGNVCQYPNPDNTKVYAKLTHIDTNSFAFVSEEILSTLLFDDNGFTVIEPIIVPNAKDVKATRTFSLGGAK